MVDPYDSSLSPIDSKIPSKERMNIGKWFPDEELNFIKAYLAYGTKIKNFTKLIKNRSVEQIKKHATAVINKLMKKHKYDPVKNNFSDVMVTEENINCLDSDIYEKIILRIFTTEKDKDYSEDDVDEFAFEEFSTIKMNRTKDNEAQKEENKNSDNNDHYN